MIEMESRSVYPRKAVIMQSGNGTFPYRVEFTKHGRINTTVHSRLVRNITEARRLSRQFVPRNQ